MDIAPFVPGGTGLRVVIKIGLDFDRMPSSDASVSPRQQAKCLFSVTMLRRQVGEGLKRKHSPKRCKY